MSPPQLPNGYNVSYVDASTSTSRSSPLELYERPLDDLHRPVALIRTLLALEGKRFDDVNSSVVEDVDDASGRSRFLLYNDQPDSGPPAGSRGMRYPHHLARARYPQAH